MGNDSDLDVILKQMATEHRPRLPSPGLIWFRAQLVRKARQKERIELPLVVMRVLTALIGALLLLVFVAANWVEIRDAIHQSGLLSPLLFLTITASLLSATILLWSPGKG